MMTDAQKIWRSTYGSPTRTQRARLPRISARRRHRRHGPPPLPSSPLLLGGRPYSLRACLCLSLRSPLFSSSPEDLRWRASPWVPRRLLARYIEELSSSSSEMGGSLPPSLPLCVFLFFLFLLFLFRLSSCVEPFPSKHEISSVLGRCSSEHPDGPPCWTDVGKVLRTRRVVQVAGVVHTLGPIPFALATICWISSRVPTESGR